MATLAGLEPAIFGMTRPEGRSQYETNALSIRPQGHYFILVKTTGTGRSWWDSNLHIVRPVLAPVITA